MKAKENLVVAIVLGIIFCVLYTVLAIKPLNSELQFRPNWTITINSAIADKEDLLSLPENEIFHFKFKEKLGYFSQDGKLLFLQEFPFKATISAAFWAAYSSNNQEFSIQNKLGEKIVTITEDGFPFFQEDRCYVFLPGGNAVVEYDSKGGKKWIYEGFVPIVSFNSSKEGSIIGFADGNLVCLAPDGTKISSFFPGGSEAEVILGVAIASSGNLAACVSGINKQRFILFQVSERQTKVLYHQYLSGNLREQTFVKFNQAGTTVYFNSNEGLGILDCKTQKFSHIKIAGKILAIEEVPGTDLLCVLSKTSSNYTVSIVEKFNNLLGNFSFSAQNAFILTGKNSLFVGRDDSISCMSLLRM